MGRRWKDKADRSFPATTGRTIGLIINADTLPRRLAQVVFGVGLIIRGRIGSRKSVDGIGDQRSSEASTNGMRPRTKA